MNPQFKTTSGLSVRKGPGVGYDRIKTLNQGEIVEEVLIPGWCPIALGEGQVGWISRDFLVEVASAPAPVPGQITGEMLLEAAEQMIGKQKYVYGADSPLVQHDNYEGATDCAEFASERCQEVTGNIYGAINPESANPDPWTGQWYAEMQAGELIQISVEEAMRTPGALLLRFDKVVHHIAFSDGKKGTVEAKGAAYGVCRDKASGRGFQYGILLPGVLYREVT